MYYATALFKRQGCHKAFGLDIQSLQRLHQRTNCCSPATDYNRNELRLLLPKLAAYVLSQGAHCIQLKKPPGSHGGLLHPPLEGLDR